MRKDSPPNDAPPRLAGVRPVKLPDTFKGGSSLSNDENESFSSGPSDLEMGEGIKMISSLSLEGIRRDGESKSFNFSDKGISKSYLPNQDSKPFPTEVKTQVSDSTYHYGQSPTSSLPRQVGIIKPITRDDIDKAVKNSHRLNDNNCTKMPAFSETRANSDSVGYPLKISDNSNKAKSAGFENPSSASKQQLSVSHPEQSAAHNNSNKCVPKNQPEPVMNSNGLKDFSLVSAKPAQSMVSPSSSSSATSSDEEPSILPENTVEPEIKSVNFEIKKCEILDIGESPKAAKRNAKDRYNFGMNNEKKTESNYRDKWKKRNKEDQQNTMVFNFVNSQKDVTHIENDGLDLSKRSTKNKHNIAKVSTKQLFYLRNMILFLLHF